MDHIANFGFKFSYLLKIWKIRANREEMDNFTRDEIESQRDSSLLDSSISFY